MSDRDSRGRFVKGYKGGPGRRPRSAESEYLKITTGRVSGDKWKSVVTKALNEAQQGDKYARKWLSDILIGRPSTPALVAGVDTDLIERLILALRAVSYEPEEVFLTMLHRLENKQDGVWHEYRNNNI